jgi:MFS family permease
VFSKIVGRSTNRCQKVQTWFCNSQRGGSDFTHAAVLRVEVKNPDEAAGSSLTKRPTFLINRPFGFFWVGQSVSTLGSQVTAFAVPLLAALTLHATAQQMGFLRAAEFAPFLVLTLPAGVWADLGIRRVLMILSNLVRGVLIVIVPLAVLLGMVRLEVLYVVMFAMGSFKVIFEMAYQTYIPEIVDRETLVNANSKIMMSYALGQSAGPGLAGIMVEIMGAPMAVLADSIGYFLCAGCLFRIRHREVRRGRHQQNIFRQIGEGFRYVGKEPHIRALLCLVTVNNFFMNALMALVVFYATREIGFRPGIFGMAVSVGGLGAVIGSLSAQRLGAWLGPGPFVIYACGVASLAAFCFPLVNQTNGIGILCLTTAYFALSAGGAAVTVFAWTIRQAMTPSELLGKMNGAFRFCVTGIMPFGALFGGWLGSVIGIRQTLVVSAAGLLASCLVASYSHLRHLKTLPHA